MPVYTHCPYTQVNFARVGVGRQNSGMGAIENAVNALGGVSLQRARALVSAALAHHSLAEFIKQAWHVHHSGPLQWNWHLDAICKHLEAVLPQRRIRKLIVNISPGCMKSLAVSVYWPVWLWARDPSMHVLAVAAANDVALRDARRAHELIVSEWYQATIAPDWKFDASQDAKGYFVNTANGSRMSRSTGQKVTGLRGDLILCDDLLDARDAHNDKKALVDHTIWFDEGLSTRKTSEETPIVIIGQRLHERDITGHCLSKEFGGWQLLRIPMEFDGKAPPTSIGWQDPRTKEGELMFPQRFDAETVEDIKRTIGPRAYAAQYQQLPAPAEGAIFREKTFKYYEHQPQGFDFIIQSWDFAFRRSSQADFSVGHVWGVFGSERYLLESVRERMNLPDCILAIKELARRWPGARAVLVEARANGPDVIRAVQTEVVGVIPIEPKGSKEARAAAVTPQLEAGNIHFPRRDLKPWVDAFLREIMSFPAASKDDQVDAMTQALIWISQNQQTLPGILRL